MIDINAILKKVEEQKTFEIYITEENEEESWILRIKKPSPRKSQRWINFIMSNFMEIIERQKKAVTLTRSSDFEEVSQNEKQEEEQGIDESVGRHFIIDKMDTLITYAEEIMDLTESWEGINAQNAKQVKQYMLLSPMKAASFALTFITDFHNWQESLKKSLPQESNGNSD